LCLNDGIYNIILYCYTYNFFNILIINIINIAIFSIVSIIHILSIIPTLSIIFQLNEYLHEYLHEYLYFRYIELRHINLDI